MPVRAPPRRRESGRARGRPGPGGKRSRDPGGGVSAGALSRARRSMFNLSARTSGARTSGRERDAPIVQSRCKFI
ncbi:MAG: hypothetical protein ACK55Z_29470, partial [bacterium]